MLEKNVKMTDGDTQWMRDARFGLFIHWGLYALPARHEWVKKYEKMTDEHYERYLKHFDPDLFDPKFWAETSWQAGMRYFVITAKHHEGFCLWDTKLTDYKAPNTSAGRDLLCEIIDAFRSRGFKVGLYYSLLDWHHSQYTLDICHPMQEDAEWLAADAGKDLAKYVDYMHEQTRELLSNYGKIDILWYDFSIPETGGFKCKGKDEWRSEELIKMIRELQPDILINNRLGIKADFETPEQVQPREWYRVDGEPVWWEACQTFSGSWGYHRDETSWKSVDTLIKMLIDTVSKGGNLLLNVGPNARGEIDSRALERFSGLARWMRLHARAIYGCTQAPDEIPCPEGCRLTYNPTENRLYVHVFDWAFRQLYLDGMQGKIEYAQLLNDASEIIVEEKGKYIILNLPIIKPDTEIPVIELFLEHE